MDNKLKPCFENIELAIVGSKNVNSLNFLMEESLFHIHYFKDVREIVKNSQVFPIIIIEAFQDLAHVKNQITMLNHNFEHTQILLIQKNENIIEANNILNQGVFWCLSHPINRETFLTLLHKAFILFEFKKENSNLQNALRYDFKIPMGKSQIMQKVLEQVNCIKNLESSILLYGASGTGKSMLAEYIHRSSTRAKKAFLSLSCAALPHDLLESELFGYEKGAFTGAHRSKKGCFELAEEGTLFLDEIAELPLDIQAKLLKILQDFEVRRLGSENSRKINVRIITATNKNLEEMCQQGTFRKDLFFRLDVLRLFIPSLSERKEDILTISDKILSQIAKKRDQKRYFLMPEALNKLENYNWPGNIRELENVLERASAFANDGYIKPDDLVFSFLSKKETQIIENTNLYGFTIKELEKKAIQDTLLACQGNKQLAAKHLGVSLKTLYNKLV